MQGLLFQKIRDALRRGVDAGVYSGAQCAFTVDGERVSCFAGKISHLGPPVTGHSRFDVASLTKLFTSAAVFGIADQGIIDISSPIGGYADFVSPDSPFAGFTIEHLLAHESGLPAWKPYFEKVQTDQRGTAEGRAQILDMVYSEAILPTPNGKARYSDLGFIGLGDILGRLCEQGLDEVIAQYVTGPLGLERTCFAGVGSSGLGIDDVASTEHCQWRRRVLKGEVHDDNAWAMGGVAGHAGVFSTAEDICSFGEAWLKALNGGGWISKTLAKKAFSRREGGRTLGFDIKDTTGSSAGRFAGAGTIGHLGFTGTSVWIDPDKKAVIALLTNRVHPSRDNDSIRQFRPELHDLFFGNI